MIEIHIRELLNLSPLDKIKSYFTKINEGFLTENIPNDIMIVGEIDILHITYQYNELNLYKLNCNHIMYYRQINYSIKNHILPNNLKIIWLQNNKIISLPNYLPNQLEELYCYKNNITHLPDLLPDSLIRLDVSFNKIKTLPENLPNNLKMLSCEHNLLEKLPDHLPNKLDQLICSNNKLKYLPKLNENLKLTLKQNSEFDYISYNPNIILFDNFLITAYMSKETINKLMNEKAKIKIKGYEKIIITQNDYDEYMKLYSRTKFKSAKKIL